MPVSSFVTGKVGKLSWLDCVAGGKAMRRRNLEVVPILLMICGVGGITGVARAQINVAVTNSVAITVAAGSSISNAGTFTVTNNSGATVTISAINLSATNPGVFSSMTMIGQVPGTSSVSALSSPNPPGTSNTFDFSALPALPNGFAATFTLTATASSAPVPTPTPASSMEDRGIIYAATTWPTPFGRSKAPAALLALMALVMLTASGKLRRRHLVMLAISLILAATEVGCGNTTGTGSASSDQQVQTITVSSGGAATGLPADLGTITVQ
jgi:hypothetical protein